MRIRKIIQHERTRIFQTCSKSLFKMALDQAMKYRQYSHSSTLLLRQPTQSQLCLVTQFICEANKSRAEFILINFLTRNCVYPFPDPHRSPIKIVLTPLTPVGKRGKGIQSSGSLKWPVRSDLTDRLDKHTSY